MYKTKSNKAYLILKAAKLILRRKTRQSRQQSTSLTAAGDGNHNY